MDRKKYLKKAKFQFVQKSKKLFFLKNSTPPLAPRNAGPIPAELPSSTELCAIAFALALAASECDVFKTEAANGTGGMNATGGVWPFVFLKIIVHHFLKL